MIFHSIMWGVQQKTGLIICSSKFKIECTLKNRRLIARPSLNGWINPSQLQQVRTPWQLKKKLHRRKRKTGLGCLLISSDITMLPSVLFCVFFFFLLMYVRNSSSPLRLYQNRLLLCFLPFQQTFGELGYALSHPCVAWRQGRMRLA